MIAILVSGDGLRRAISIPYRMDEIRTAIYPTLTARMMEPEFCSTTAEMKSRKYVLVDRKSRDVYIYKEVPQAEETEVEK